MRTAKSSVFQEHDNHHRDFKISINIVLAAELALAALIGIPLALMLLLDLKAAYAARAHAREKLRRRGAQQAHPTPH